jgi:hypothetical protein
MTISEQELSAHSFSEWDAIFVTDSVQVEFLAASGNRSLSQSWLIPLSTHAYASVLKLEYKKVRSYFDSVDFDECRHWYEKLGLDYSKTWLKELGLEFQVEGIDIPELDAPCQFLFFVQAISIAGTADRLIRTSPEIETFYVIEAEHRLPSDFYFDSDVPAALLRFVCERLHRKVLTISMKERPRFIFPDFQERPIMNSLAKSTGNDQAAFKFPPFSRHRIGFVPATIANSPQIFDAIRKLGFPLVVFRSIWPTIPFLQNGLEEDQYTYHLSGVDGEWSTAIAVRLKDLHDHFLKARTLSTLPDCIIANPHLDFQYEYIFMRRWLAYANMISRAVRFFAKTSPDLLVISDHFTAEAAILARLFRRSGTRVLVALHSGWPCDLNWASWASSDSAMVPSNSCAHRIRELSGMTNIFVTGPHKGRRFRSLLHSRTLAGKKRSLAAHRKIVLVVTNASELNCVPYAALDSHFETLTTFGQIPVSLQDRILVAIRTKPGQLGDDPILYRELCGLPAESFSFLDGLDFSQSVEIADCVVGLNIPTNGYFDVLGKGVPLIHVQTASVVAMHPNLPPEVVPRINKIQDIWPIIEATVFDARHRQQLLEIQQGFVMADFTPTVFGDGDPIECLIRELLGYRSSCNLGNFLRDLWHRVPSQHWRGHRPFALVESCLPLSQQGGAGNVDDILLGSDGSTLIVGWAADLMTKEPAKAIHVFHDGLCIAERGLGQSRPDVAAFYHDDRLKPSGFSILLTSVAEKQARTLLLYSELRDGTFFQLKMPILPT